MKIRQQRELVAQREEVERRRKRLIVLDVEDPNEIEYILAVRCFHEYELTDDHLKVAKIPMVQFVKGSFATRHFVGLNNL